MKMICGTMFWEIRFDGNPREFFHYRGIGKFIFLFQ